MAHNESKRTKDHDEIRRWVEERGGRPSAVESTWDGNGGTLRIDFGEPEDNLIEISWEDFFRVFDESGLEFVYQEETAEGETSRFSKLVAAE